MMAGAGDTREGGSAPRLRLPPEFSGTKEGDAPLQGGAIPELRTERLVLGGFGEDHLAAFTTFVRSERSRFLGGPTEDPRDAWDSCLIHLGQWLARGYGTFWLREAATGRPAGRVGLWHPLGYDEPELSWVVYDGFEGRGYAAEAARAARAWAWEARGLGPLMSLIAPENLRSAALAERLGCRPEAETTTPSGRAVVRWRHPAEPA